MTAIRSRRRRSTLIALAASVVALVAAGVLTYAGAQTLIDSKAGRLAAGQTDERPVQRMPYTPTAMLGVTDDDGRLTSLVAMAVQPDGTGGTIVELAATADASGGLSDAVEPLAAVLAMRGPDEFRLAAENLTGLSFDAIEVTDEARLAELISPLGDLPVVLPGELYDASTGERWPAGEQSMPATAASRALAAADPLVADYLYEPARQAVWSSIATRVGAGIGSAEAVASDADLPRPADLDEFMARLFADKVSFRAIGVRPLDADRVSSQLPADLAGAYADPAAATAVIHFRSEVLMVLASIAPGRMGAPITAPNFRVVSPISDDELAAGGWRDSDLLRYALDRLFFAKVNVISVAEVTGQPVPDHTTFRVADPTVVAAVRDQYNDVFGGNIEVDVASSLIDGIDIEVVLGRDFLDTMPTEPAEPVAGSSGDDTATDSSDG